MRLQDLTTDHLEILENWERQEIFEQIVRLSESYNVWDKFHRLNREEKDELWGICS